MLIRALSTARISASSPAISRSLSPLGAPRQMLSALSPSPSALAPPSVIFSQTPWRLPIASSSLQFHGDNRLIYLAPLLASSSSGVESEVDQEKNNKDSWIAKLRSLFAQKWMKTVLIVVSVLLALWMAPNKLQFAGIAYASASFL